MELTEATTADIDALVDRWYALAETMATYDELNRVDGDGVREAAENGFREQLDEDGVSIYLVTQQDDTIGYVTLRVGEHPSREYTRYLRIVDLRIDDGHRGRGHGREVIERVKRLARAQDCDHLKVSCEWENDDARRFYRETGFRPKQVEYAQPLE